MLKADHSNDGKQLSALIALLSKHTSNITAQPTLILCDIFTYHLWKAGGMGNEACGMGPP